MGKKPGPKQIDWVAARTEYITTRTTYPGIAMKYGLSEQVVSDKARSEKWREQRREFQRKSFARAMGKAETAEANRLSKLISATERAVDVVSRAFEDDKQFNRYLVERREKYAAGKLDPGFVDENGEPVVVEERTWTEERQFAKLDTKSIRDLTVVLKDLTGMMRDFYNIPTTDQAEARRIAAERLEIEKQKAYVGSDEDEDECGVVLLPPIMEGSDDA